MSKPSVVMVALMVAPWLAAENADADPVAPIRGAPNPEDLVQLPGTPWVVVSAMRSKDHPGALLAVDARAGRAAVSFYAGPRGFAPHGIAVRPLGGGRFELLVVDHGGGEAIDRLTLHVVDGRPPVVSSARRIPLPPGTSANGVAPLPDGGLVMTSMFDPRDRRFVARLAAREATGGVWRWSSRSGWRAIARPRLSGANGIAVDAGGTNVFVSEWAARRLWRIPLAGGEATFTTTSFLPDNLRWTSGGELLVAGQTATPGDLFGCQDGARRCPMGFVVARVDPKTLEVRPVLGGDERAFAASGFGGATVALEVGPQIWVGSFAGDRIARFAAPAADDARR